MEPIADDALLRANTCMVGVVSGVGHTTRLGRSVAFLEATLSGPNGGILARATATAAPTPFSE